MEKIQKSAAELKALLQKNNTDARTILTALFDEGTFMEIGAYVKNNASEKEEWESVITGCGAVDGRLVYAFCQDFQNKKGAFGVGHADKIVRVIDMAIKNGAPVIGVFNSAGASLEEGVDALAGYGRVMKAVSSACGIVPTVAVVSGLCGASAAAVCELFDFVIAAEDKGQLYVVSPFLTKTSAADTLKMAARQGQIHRIAPDTPSAIADARTIVGYLPANESEDAPEAEADDLNRPTPALAAHDAASVVAAVADFGTFFETSALCAPEVRCGFIRIGGRSIGVVASDPSQDGGVLTPCAAHKAASFVSFCDDFDLPLLTLVDSCGLSNDPECETAHYAEKLAELASAYAVSANIKVTCIVGAAYGAAYTLLGSRALGADLALALDSAEISTMSPDSAVQFLWQADINASRDPAARRAQLISEWNNTLASPVAAARHGEVDDIIEEGEMRQRIAAAFEMLMGKRRMF